MNLANIYTSYLKTVRFMQIFGIIFSFFWKEMMLRTPWGRYKRRKQIKAQKQVYSTPERLRFTIERLGPTYVKFGQILADRPDVVAEHLRLELKMLQSKVEPFSNEMALRIIEEELRQPIEEVFDHFDKRCLAAASIGQVYQARLKDGSEVVVKVRRPKIDKKIKLDLYLLRIIAQKFAKTYPEMAAINIVGVVDEFAESIHKELDYYNEAANMLRFGTLFAQSEWVYIPKVYMEYTTRRVIVQEKIVGITPDSNDELMAAGLDPKAVASNGANVILSMIFRYGFFHADPHPGNMFIMRNNVVGLIDFGMVGVLRPRDMEFLANLSLGFARRNETSIADALITLCDIRYFDKRDDLIFRIHLLLQKSAHIPTDKLDFSKMAQDCINIITRFGLQIPGGIFMLIKALATIQKVAEHLDSQLPFTEMVKPYAKELLAKKYSPKKMANSLFDLLKSYGTLISNLPADVGEIIYKVKQGQIHHKVSFDDEAMFRRLVRNFGFQMGYAIMLVGLFIGSIILQVTKVDLPYSNFLIWISSALIFMAIIRWLFKKK
ncbi:Ubiquinone biosynthesis monooxygenase UbiB [Mucinivorans hirudinis]|uniref:Ubiquinone biosynthesis monooxygenase UbiB n=1 Tax=Mucinivorans hirudinis TaxID=1433126 RepID=A0A060RCT5_9BACT|nr:Ubiquinone biosynthesis monooxygenase UbiB [Mucinivorans hirudinis]